MNLKKTDVFNISCLKLFHLNVLTEEECLAKMKWGNKISVYQKESYLKRMIGILACIDRDYPGLIEKYYREHSKIGR